MLLKCRTLILLMVVTCAVAATAQEPAQQQNRNHDDAVKLAGQIEAHLCVHDKPNLEASAVCLDCAKGKSGGADEVKSQTEALKLALDEQTARDLAFFEFLKKQNSHVDFNFESKEEFEKQIHEAELTQSALQEYQKTIPDDSQLRHMLEAVRHSFGGHATAAQRELTKKFSDYLGRQLSFWKNHPEVTGWNRTRLMQLSSVDKLSDSIRTWLKTHDDLSNFPDTLETGVLLSREGNDREDVASKLKSMAYNISYRKSKIEALEEDFKKAGTTLEEALKPKDDSPREKLRVLEVQAHLPIKALNRMCDLSPGEQLAISIYTASGYGFLNRSLWSGGKDAEEVQPFRDELNAALKKLTAFHGYVQRSVDLPSSVAAGHQPGQIVTYSAFTSTSLYRVFSSRHYQLEILSKTGRLVKSFSHYSGELEVLFPSDRKFKVLSREKEPNGQEEIVLEEVDP